MISSDRESADHAILSMDKGAGQGAELRLTLFLLDGESDTSNG
jgi:hypothetical protein